MKRSLICTLICATLLVLAGCTESAIVSPELAEDTELSVSKKNSFPLKMSINDPRNDHTGRVDVLRFEMYFDPATGAYEIHLKADEDAPFHGEFEVNIIMWNEHRKDTNDEFFLDNFNEFNYQNPTQKLVMSGTSDRLKGWQERDKVWIFTMKELFRIPFLRSNVRDAHHGAAAKTKLHDEDFIANDTQGWMTVRKNHRFEWK